MKRFEYTYMAIEPFLPVLHREIRRRLRQVVANAPGTPRILDIGGRKSHDTIGIRGRVVVTDLPREHEVQRNLNLGITPAIMDQLKRRRSNLLEVRFDDMTHSALESESFDIALAVEVLEHVDEDERFVSEVHRVLKPGGTFLMTTPNGDWLPNTNPDHRRHYRREQLHELLSRHFAKVEVEYGVKAGPHHARGLRSWSLRRPIGTAVGMLGNVVNGLESRPESLREQPIGTCHLFATAIKSA